MTSVRKKNRGLKRCNRFEGSNQYCRALRLELLEYRQLLATVTWDGGAGNFEWTNPQNWDTDSLPGPADDVIIPDLTPDATITHSSGASVVRSLTSAESIRIAGSSDLTISQPSSVAASLTVDDGRIAPNILSVAGDYTQSANGTLDIAISGVAEGTFGQLAIGGTATIDGTLNVAVVNPFSPSTGDNFDFLEYESRVGDFDQTTGLNGATHSLDLTPYGTLLRLTATPMNRLTVRNLNDSGPDSLRFAIQQANANAGLDYIAFDIPGAGPHSISLQSVLPNVTDPVFINGTSEPDFAGTPIVELDGSALVGASVGLAIDASSSEIRGMLVNGFSTAIEISSGIGNTIAGNYVGIAADGGSVAPNRSHGIIVRSAGNTIGGNSSADRNVISGNRENGILVTGTDATGTHIIGNYVGTNAAGDEAANSMMSRAIGLPVPCDPCTTGTLQNGDFEIVELAAGSAGDGLEDRTLWTFAFPEFPIDLDPSDLLAADFSMTLNVPNGNPENDVLDLDPQLKIDLGLTGLPAITTDRS